MLRYLDASVVIDATDPSSPKYPVVVPLLRALPLAELATSEIVRLECLVGPTRSGNSVRIASLESYLGSLVDLPLDRAVYDFAIRLRADRKGLKTPDALHLAAALRHGCAEFWTSDLDLARIPTGIAFRTF